MDSIKTSSCPVCNSSVQGQFGVDEEEKSENIKLLESLEPKKVSKIILNASQLRALNYFHCDRFKIPKQKM